VTQELSRLRRTRSLNLWIPLLVGLGLTSSAWGYKQLTHQRMTEQAVQRSLLGDTNSAVLQTLQCQPLAACSIGAIEGFAGQGAYDEDNGLRSFAHFFDPQNSSLPGAPLSIALSIPPAGQQVSLAQVGYCTVFEAVNFSLSLQSGPPCTGTGVLSMPVGMDSNDWAHYGTWQNNPVFQIPVPISSYTVVNVPPTGCGPGAGPPYLCDYADMKADLVLALSSKTPTARINAALQLYESLGHVLHHVQDMAQPQHVRNDAHCDSGLCTVLESVGIQGSGYATAGYEEYVDGVVPANISAFADLAAAGPLYQLNKLPPASFSIPDNFWATGSYNEQGIGLAEFASFNFLSVGTGPMVAPGLGPSLAVTVSTTADPAHPQPGALHQQYQPLPLPNGGMIPNRCFAPNQLPEGSQFYLTGAITDQMNAGPAVHGYDQSYEYAPLGVFSTAQTVGSSTPNQSIKWSVTQNCVTYDQQMFLLVPQAIRYSAWFIDFLFRGSSSINGAISSDGTTLTIKNTSPTNETLNSDGTGALNHRGIAAFELYSDDAAGNRQCVWSSASMSGCMAPPSACAATNIVVNQSITCSLGNLGNPPSSGKYLLVYNGTMGYENNQSAFTSVGAPSKSVTHNFVVTVAYTCTGGPGNYCATHFPTSSQIDGTITGPVASGGYIAEGFLGLFDFNNIDGFYAGPLPHTFATDGNGCTGNITLSLEGIVGACVAPITNGYISETITSAAEP
jgi:hypothetical protein